MIAWRERGIWRKIHRKLVEKVRVKAKRTPHPSVVIIDSQSTRTGKLAKSSTRGYDGGKRVKGRKRHFVVDTSGLLLDVSVTPANVHDNNGGRKVLKKMGRKAAARDSVKVVYADKGYSGENFSDWVKENLDARVKVGENHAKRAKKFIPAKKRWVVERTFAWMRDYRRLTEDMERSVKNSMTMIRLAFIRVMLRKLSPVEKEWA